MHTDNSFEMTAERRLDLRPAFSSPISAISFVVVVLFALLLPELITFSGSISRRDSYDIMPENQGNYTFVAKEIYESDEDIDLLFIGSSLIWNGIDAPAVQQALSRKLGRPARVMTFGHYFNSIDISYNQLRDLLERKRVRMVAFSVPRTPLPPGPSTTAYRFLRYSEDPELVAGLAWEGRASLYACAILRSPHDLLTMLRPNLSEPSRFTETLGADKAEVGMGRDPRAFRTFAPAAPSLAADHMVFSDSTRHVFHFTNERIPPHQDHYLQNVVRLLSSNGVPLMMVNIPQYSERHSTRVIEREEWSQRFGIDIPLIGVAPSELYAGLTEDEIELLHFDAEHMNKNGNERFTRAIMPAILEVYDRYVSKNK